MSTNQRRTCSRSTQTTNPFISHYAVACEPNVERLVIGKASPSRPSRTYFSKASTSSFESAIGESDPENRPSTSAGFKRSRC
ncbi:hypothetical protein Aduo_019618 [Ancylostoma duodenale]